MDFEGLSANSYLKALAAIPEFMTFERLCVSFELLCVIQDNSY
jgi:hypothetical protein